MNAAVLGLAAFASAAAVADESLMLVRLRVPHTVDDVQWAKTLGGAGTWYFGASVDDCGELAFGGDVTADIQAKIDAAASRGGGEVVVLSGEHRVTSLWLRSGVTLHLARDARLVASRDCSAYPKVEGGHPAGVVNARGMKDVKIIGEPGSCIDGGNCYNPQGGEGYRGPHAIWIVDSTNVVVRGMSVRDSANYAVSFLRCRDTLVEGFTAEGGHDGIHHDVCDGVRISGCRLETGDDSIAGACCTDVVVSNCVLNSACSPIRYGGRDVLITDCRVTGPAKHPHRWTLTKEEKARGARSSEVKGRRTTGCFYQTYTGDRPIMGFRPGNVVIRNVTVENCERFMVSLSGISGAIWQNGVAIPDVTFENVHATGLAKPSVVAAPADSPLQLTFKNCSFGFRSPQKTAFVVSNVKVSESDVSLERVSDSLFEERTSITYDDIPEFPSWQVEDAATRAIWGLPSLSCGLADMATSHDGACGADPHELTVSPGGMSPQDALLAIRAAKAKGVCGAWTVRVKPGAYTLKETLQFAPCDSGTPDAPVTWVGGGTNTMFAGGEILRDWRNEGGGVWSAPIPRSPSGESAYFEQLWVNGRRADRARLPDSSSDNPVDGYFRIAAASIQAVTNAEGKVTYVEHVTPSNAAALALMPADEMKWAQMCVVHKWAFSRRIIKAVDPATLVVETHSPKDWDGWRQWNPDETLVFFENVRPAFDAPGEWFYDAKSGRVLYRPLPGEDMTKVQAVVPSSKISRLVEFAGDPDNGEYVHDILFKGITFAYSDSTSEDGGHGPTQSYQLQAARGCDGTITARGVRRILFDGCTVAHTGNYGIRFNDGCMSNTVMNCCLFDLGAGGVWMGAISNYVAKGETLSRRAIGNYTQRSTAFNRIENCIMRNGGLFNPEGTGVACTHVSDSKVLNCDISDFYYTGISVGFTWGYRGSVAQRNEIAFNRIYDLGKGVMSDMGGVYTLGTSFGTRVHHNVVHGVRAYSYGGWGLYADEGSEGITMDHNICWDTTDGGFHQHYGVGCVIRNNIFAWNRKLGAVRMLRQVVNDIPSSLHFVGNIVVVREGPLVGRGPRGVGGVWASNLWYDYSGKPKLDGLDWNDWKNCGKEIGGAYADPCFVDADANDFRLKPESPAFALGFRPWDYSAIAQGVTADSNDVLMANGIVVDGKVCRETERRDFADGFAVRYLLPDGVCTVSCERTEWVVPENAKIWYQPLCMEYEHPYVSQMVGRIAAGTLMNMPVTLKLSDGSYRLLTEANVVNHSDASLEYCGGGRFAIRYADDKNGFKRPGGASPWRVTLVAKDLQTLATSDIVRRLCPDPSPEVAAKCAAFVKGGRSVWQWLPAGAPKYCEQKEWYDRTKELGFEYYLVDDGWKVWRDGDMDQWACLKKWIDYGKSIGVESFVWVDSKEMRTREARRAYLGKVRDCGAVGIKIDFVPAPSCSQMKWYEETLADTLEFSLMTDFHGCVKPSGRERTWPHEVAREAIRGHEWHITRYNRVLPPEHDCILPFNRLVQGHADYTPMVFEKKELQGYSWARELAQGVVFSARFLCFGDYPQNYLDNPAVELIKAMPAEYDETRILPGSEIGKCVAVAKRKGLDWFVAVENGAEGRRIAVKLDFLGTDNCELLGFADAEDRPDGYRIDRRVVGRDGKIELTLRPCGGYCARIAPITVNTIANEDGSCPVSTNIRGHENIEWSISYAYHLADAKKNLPRVLLVGDSICQGYQGKTAAKLDGKANVTYWASSYCVTSAAYMPLLTIYLDEAKYDVVHFNNGLHSCGTPVADYEKSYRAALQLIKAKQPKAKLVWASSTPLNTENAAMAEKVVQLNEAARRAADVVGDIDENDLFALMNPLERSAYWVDTHHYSNAGYELIASQVVEKVTTAVSPGARPTLACRRSYASVEAAREAARTMTKPAVVHLAAGTYRLEKPIVLKPENSGVTYVADGDVVISGARPVTDWRLEPDGTWSAPVPWVKPDRTGGFRSMRVNGAMRPRARLPKKGHFTVVNDDLPQGTSYNAPRPELSSRLRHHGQGDFSLSFHHARIGAVATAGANAKDKRGVERKSRR